MTPRRSSPFHWRQVAGCVGIGLVSMAAWGAAATAPKGEGPSAEEYEAQMKRIEKTLDEILEVQAGILARYEELMQELQIVKIRVSR